MLITSYFNDHSSQWCDVIRLTFAGIALTTNFVFYRSVQNKVPIRNEQLQLFCRSFSFRTDVQLKNTDLKIFSQLVKQDKHPIKNNQLN